MHANQTSSSARLTSLAFVLVWLASVVSGFGAEPVNSLAPLVATNLVRVTNVVVVSVTNYAVTTNLVLNTNRLVIARTNTLLPNLSWVPPEDKFDWIQLKSGEWLKGRLKAIQKRKLEFESEELNDLTFDWKDIRQVRSPHLLDVLSVDGQEVSGPVTITPDQVSVSGASPRVFARDLLQSITPGGSKERNYWSGKVTIGLSLQAGNTEQVEYNAQAHLERRSPATRFSLDYIGNLSSINGVENANNQRVNTEFDLWLSRRLYLLLPFAEYYKDPFQNLAGRFTIGSGLGYDLVVAPKLEWNITTGPAYQWARFDSTQPDEATQTGTAALVFSSRFDWDIARGIDLILEYRGQYTSREAGDTTHHSVSTLSLELTKRLDLDISFIWDRINNPKVGADGLQPKPDDYRLVVGLGVDF